MKNKLKTQSESDHIVKRMEICLKSRVERANSDVIHARAELAIAEKLQIQANNTYQDFKNIKRNVEMETEAEIQRLKKIEK